MTQSTTTDAASDRAADSVATDQKFDAPVPGVEALDTDAPDIDLEDAQISHPLHGDAPVAEQAPTFAELGVDERIVRSLNEAGIERTFAIQSLTLPIALAGSDLIGQARTGMGKTLGFGVPLLQRLAEESAADTPMGALPGGRSPRALVMVPTRELCVQVCRDLHDAAKHLRLVVSPVYGGRAYEPQIAALQAGVDVVVGTPGRLLDLAKSSHLVLGGIKVLVLDEADEMLDLGFLPDIERVLGMVPARRQTMLFSATMPGPIITLARTFMVQPTHIRAELPADSIIHLTTTQFVYRAHALDKVEMLSRLLQARGRGLTMVFTRTKRTAAKVADELATRGFASAAVHGDLGQGAREQALRAFRSGKVDVLVATDVAARGIDVEGVTHVVNYQCPEDQKTYIHRIGRTGRAGRTGVAVTFVDWDDMPRWKLINDTLGLDFAEPAETYSNSAHLYSDLDIPAGTTARLPRSARVRAGLDAEQVEDIGETGRRHRTDGSHGKAQDGGHGARGDRHGDRHSGSRRDGDRPARAIRRTSGDTDTGDTDSGGKDSGGRGSPASAVVGPSGISAAPKRRRARRRTRSGSPATGHRSPDTAPDATTGS